nr:unnamed protein product [Digitaria exilis]
MHTHRAAGVPVLALLVAAAALALTTTIPSVAAQPWPGCDAQSGNYSAGSAYATDLQQLISDLQTKASTSPALFASSSGDAGADTVYGLMLCRGDISASDCFDCGTRAGQDVEQFCNRTRDTALVYNQCYVRVSPVDFLASPNNTGLVQLRAGVSIPAGVDVGAYDAAVTQLLNATSRYAVDSSSSSSSSSAAARMYFATGQLVGLDPRVPNIWSTAQCAGDLSPEQCRGCLGVLVARWWNGSGFDLNEEGARLTGSRCNLRSELGDKFYTGAPMVKLQMNGEEAVPAPAPSTTVAASTGGGDT